MKVGLESYITEVFNVEANEFGLKTNVDLLEKEKEAAHQRNLKYQLQTVQYYDSSSIRDLLQSVI